MNIVRKPIRSARAESDGRPWYDIDAPTSAGKTHLRFGQEANRNRGASPLRGQDVALEDQINAVVAAGLSDGEFVVVAVTLDDKLEVVRSTQQRPIYHAHLGFYYPPSYPDAAKADTLELLEFIE